MWAFFSARLRTWLLLAVGVPALAWSLGKIGDVVEARRGPNAVSRVLHAGRRWLGRRARGPLARRPAADPAGPADAGAPAR